MKNLRLVIAATGLLVLTAGCRSAAMKQVEHPRNGTPLGGRVAVVYSSRYQIRLGGLERIHPFDIHKYARIYRALVKDGVVQPGDVYVPAAVSDADILRVHTPAYCRSLKDSSNVARYMEASAVAILPDGVMQRRVLTPFRYTTGGTLLATRLALQHGIGINIGGGYHHAKPDVGEGFCVLADIPIAVQALRHENKLRRVLVVDLDVHQGNGTIACFRHDEEAYTFSIHQRDIYPIPKEHGDYDVEVDAGMEDEEYLRLLAGHLPEVFKKAKPDIVYLVAGADTLTGDSLASLEMTAAGVVRRDAMVIDECVKRKIPVVVTLGGGYSKQTWDVQFQSIRRTIRTHGRPQPED